ncbi:hypothetical protein OSB04_010649 [Centaurea solstitialis]|uniref:LRAT domain-containing protein n=1 Tax=Centaurea solstitialis TaxID=347529 RepID=A0AA38T7Z2_9ASTR|nr:hypothetical protein OSB04_010649 [Centaurea solstitialis]
MDLPLNRPYGSAQELNTVASRRLQNLNLGQLKIPSPEDTICTAHFNQFGPNLMGFLSNKVQRTHLKPGHHIYTYRALFAYSHHELNRRSNFGFNHPNDKSFIMHAGIFVGGNKVVHFTCDPHTTSCTTYPDCGFRQPKSGVVLSCLDCFLRDGDLYVFEYGVTPTVFLAKVRGGTCTTAVSDGVDTVVHRAMRLLQNGFGKYDVFQNNCEDFALYCKTGLLILDKVGCGRSGQAASVLAALVSSPLKLLIPSPAGVATVTAGMYCMTRYASDIGVRSDVVKVSVEDLAMKLRWMDDLKQEESKSG